MEAPETVVDAMRLLRSEGYDLEYQLVDGALQCDLDHPCAVGDAVVERLFRFEGPSDPGDEMIVFGLWDPIAERRGVLASAFGSAADPDVLEHLVGLASRFDRGGSDGVSPSDPTARPSEPGVED
jgi:hypothetical protein